MISAEPIALAPVSSGACLTGDRFDLKAIALALQGLREDMDCVNYKLHNHRAALARDSVRHVVQAYSLLDYYLSSGVRLLSLGHSREVLAINHCVLFGQENTGNENFYKAYKASEKHFYSQGDASIGGMLEWYARHRKQSVWLLAAGVYLHTIQPPQLFLEGNHRTGVLLANYVLARANQNPLVLDRQLAPVWFALTEAIQNRHRRLFDPRSWWRSPKHDLADLIQESVNKRYLRGSESSGF